MPCFKFKKICFLNFTRFAFKVVNVLSVPLDPDPDPHYYVCGSETLAASDSTIKSIR